MKHTYCLWLLAIAMLASCSPKDYRSVIPKSASMVAAVDVQRIANGADFEHSHYLALAKSYVGLLASGRGKKQLAEFIDNPQQMGLDFTRPAYVFETDSRCWGLLVKVEDDGLLDIFFQLLHGQHLCSALTEDGGLRRGTLLGDLQFAYNGESFLMLASKERNASELRSTMVQLFQLPASSQFISGDAFCRLSEDCDIALYSNMNALPVAWRETCKSVLPPRVRPTDVELVASVTFGEGEAHVAVEAFGATPEVQKMFADYDKNTHTLKGKFIGTAPDDCLAWASAGCSGQWLLEMLKHSDEGKRQLMLLERAMDIEAMVAAIDGDVALTLPASRPGGAEPEQPFVAIAEVGTDAFMREADEWAKSARDYGIRTARTAENQYTLHADDYSLRWGIDRQSLYFASDGIAPSDFFSHSNPFLTERLPDIQKSKLFIYINAESLLRGSRDIPPFVSPKVRSLVITSERAGHYELRIAGNDPTKNILTQLF